MNTVTGKLVGVGLHLIQQRWSGNPELATIMHVCMYIFIHYTRIYKNDSDNENNYILPSRTHSMMPQKDIHQADTHV